MLLERSVTACVSTTGVLLSSLQPFASASGPVSLESHPGVAYMHSTRPP